MSSLLTKTALAAICATVTISALPASAGVMSVTDKTAIGLSTPTTQVDWRAYPHRRHRWHMGFRYGRPHYPLGAAYGSAARLAAVGAYGAAYPSCGAYGAAYPTCGTYGAAYPATGCGTWGYGGGLFGLGLGPF